MSAELFILLHEGEIISRTLATSRERAERMFIGRKAYKGLSAIKAEVLLYEDYVAELQLNSYECSLTEC